MDGIQPNVTGKSTTRTTDKAYLPKGSAEVTRAKTANADKDAADKDAADEADKPYTPKEFAKKARVNVKTVYEGIRNGTVPHFRVNEVIRIPRAAGDKLLREGTA